MVNGPDNFTINPDEIKMKFHRISLLKANPFSGGTASTNIITGAPNYNTAQDIYNKPGGQPHPHTLGGSAPWSGGDFSVKPGTYDYFLVIIDNELKVKYEHTTTKDQLLGLTTTNTENGSTSGLTGTWSGYTLHQMTATNAYGDEFGKNEDEQLYIRSRGNKTTFSEQPHPDGVTLLNDKPPKISTSSGVANFDSEFFFDLQDDDTLIGKTHGNYIFEAAHSQGKAHFVLLNAAGDGYATSMANAERLAFVVELDTPKVVTDHSEFQLDFKFSKSLSMDFDEYNTTSKKVGCIKFGVNPVEINLTVQN